jgi:hypothetical protein
VANDNNSIKRIRELSDKAGGIVIHEAPENDEPNAALSSPIEIPSKAPGAVQGGLAALGSVPRKERGAVIHNAMVLATIVIVVTLMLVAAIAVYMISRGIVPSWLTLRSFEG